MLLCKSKAVITSAMLAMALAYGETGSASLAEAVHASTAAGYANRGAYFDPSMRFDAESGSLELAFGIEEGARITLHAFDTQGKQLAVLLDEIHAAGYHHLSLFSNRLQGYRGKVIFKLRSGQAVLAESRSRPL